MKLSDFIKEEQRRIALFEAWWKHNQSLARDDEVWPDDMDAGQWDEACMNFDVADAASCCIFIVEEVGGNFHVAMEESPSPGS